jgi:hypothetical protein
MIRRTDAAASTALASRGTRSPRSARQRPGPSSSTSTPRAGRCGQGRSGGRQLVEEAITPNGISRIPRRRVVGVALAFAFGVPATLMQVSAASATSPIVHRAVAGTPDACEFFADTHPGCDGDYAWTAIERADGSVSGQYSDRFSRGFGVRGVIDCLAVEGNRAWVSGLITDGFLAGQYFSSSAQDNGTSANDPVDQIGRTSISDEPLDCSTKDAVELADAPDGQVTVR